MMLKLLIADDEKVIREMISSLIDWKSLGISLIGTAANGIEAYHIILDQYPEIVLTDIRMPGLSGLELIQKIHEVNEDTQFIILSGYGDFEYAKTAMQYGVRHYLLKPCSEQQIIDSVTDICRSYKKLLATKCILKEHRQIKEQLLAKQLELTGVNPLPESGSISEQIKHYVRENLQNSDMSLKWIAENKLFMNVDYISKKFLKETGEKFSAYLTELRISRAKELLLAARPDQLSQVAEQVGCGNNPQYFSQIFKKSTGYTPNQYYKLIHGTQGTGTHTVSTAPPPSP